MNRYAEVSQETKFAEYVDAKSNEQEGDETRALTVTEMDAVGGGSIICVLL